MSKIKIAVFNRKGGVGKTTLSIILTQIALKTYKKKVLAVDLDEQCNFKTSISYIIQENEFKDLLVIDTKLKEEYITGPEDWLIMDCPANFSAHTKEAVTKADIVLIPLRPDYYSIMNIDRIYTIAGDLKEKRQFPVVKVGFSDSYGNEKSNAAKFASNNISIAGYEVLGNLPLHSKITSNISSNLHKWWSVGLPASSRSPFEKLYTEIEKLHRTIQNEKRKKDQANSKPEKIYDYYDDKDNPDIAQFGLHSRK